MLHHICHVGCTDSSSGSNHFLGYGTLYLYLERVVTEIASLKENVIYWPDEAERRLISDRMDEKYDFPHCVGMGDGTLFHWLLPHLPMTLLSTPGEKWVTVLRASSLMMTREVFGHIFLGGLVLSMTTEVLGECELTPHLTSIFWVQNT